MTLFTSEIKTSFRYLVISIVLAAAGAVYEHFSFGVWSAFMVYAFLVPLAGGALPYMIRHLRKMRSLEASDSAQAYGPSGCAGISAQAYELSGRTALNGATSVKQTCWMWHAGIATLTTGSIVQGILAISGRPNSLTIIYLIAGLLLLALSAIRTVRSTAALS